MSLSAKPVQETLAFWRLLIERLARSSNPDGCVAITLISTAVVEVEGKGSGTEDVKYILKGAEAYTVELEYALQNSTFAKYATQAQGGGAGTIDKSWSLLFSALLGGIGRTENFLQLTGSRIGSLTLSTRVGELTKARCQISGKALPVPSASSPIRSGSFATDPATNSWTFYDGGSNPVAVGAANPDVREISVTFKRNIERLHVVGGSQQKFMPAKHHRITGTFTLLWEDTSQYSNLANDTGVTITWVLKSAASTLTLNNCKIHRLEDFPISANRSRG